MSKPSDESDTESVVTEETVPEDDTLTEPQPSTSRSSTSRPTKGERKKGGSSVVGLLDRIYADTQTVQKDIAKKVNKLLGKKNILHFDGRILVFIKVHNFEMKYLFIYMYITFHFFMSTYFVSDFYNQRA